LIVIDCDEERAAVVYESSDVLKRLPRGASMVQDAPGVNYVILPNRRQVLGIEDGALLNGPEAIVREISPA
jgi:hypothetical protein